MKLRTALGILVTMFSLMGCATYQTMEFRGDSPAVRRTHGAIGVNLAQTHLEPLSDRQSALSIDLYTDSFVLILPRTGRHRRVEATTQHPLVEAWWLTGWPEKWRAFRALSPAERQMQTNAIRLEGQFSVRWRRTNDFRIHTDLRAIRGGEVIVRGDFVAEEKHEPGPWFAGVMVLFGIPFTE